MPLDQSQRIIVRVWTSKENKQFSGHNVGHVSIETPDEYISLWPVPFTPQQTMQYRLAGNLEQKYLKYFMERDPDFHQTYQDDYEAEGNVEPQVIICFYSLERYLVENEFHKLKRNTEGWRLIGSNLFMQKLEETLETVTVHTKTFESALGKRNFDNCASLARKSLIAGSIGQLVNVSEYSSFLTKTSSVVKPDDILELLIPAKLAELEKYKETQHFQFEGETDLRLAHKHTSCLIL